MTNRNEHIRSEISRNIDLEYRDFHSNLLPNIEVEILGVRLPVLRQIAKSVSFDDIEDTYLQTEMDSHEIILVHGLLVSRAKVELEERFSMIEAFVPNIKSWAICDTFCSSLKFAKKSLDETWSFLSRYKNARDEYTYRFLIIMYMQYFLTDQYVDTVLDLINVDDSEYYYVKMAKAWLIATAVINYEDRVIELLKHSKLDIFTHNKAIQKARESFRVSKEMKEYLNTLKK